MGDANTSINLTELRHALRRTGFGPTPKEMKKAERRVDSMTRGGVADYVIGQKRKILKAKGKENFDVHNKWVKHLTKGRTPFLDKTVLFWHDHFSVAASVVEHPDVMTLHLQNHYTRALGSFKDYVKAINKDAAMMIFLNTIQNRKEIPNENYPRELCELFTLGVFDLNGIDNYTQSDIVQIARAFTGWRLKEHTGAYLDEGRHDFETEFPERGPKAIFDNAHGFGPGGASFTTSGEGENEIDVVIDIIFDHLDSDGENTVARRTAFRLLEFFAYANPEKSVVDEVVADSGFAGSWNIEELIRSILCHDAFYEASASAPFAASTKKSVKWPIDYVVSTLRLTRTKPKGKDLEIRGGRFLTLFDHLENMGQVIGDPPSVFGWDWESGWISSSTLLARYAFARDIVAARDNGRFKPEKLIEKDLTDPGAIADAVTDVLGVTDQFTAAERDELIVYLTDNGAVTELDLDDFDVRNTKLHGLFALVMQSPQYQLH